VLAAAEGGDPRRRAAAGYSLMRMVGPPNTGATPVPGGTDMSAATRERAGQVLVALATGNGDLHLENFSVISRVRERCILSRL